MNGETVKALQKIEDLLKEVCEEHRTCSAHEETVKTVQWLKGGFAIVILLLGFISYTNLQSIRQLSNNSASLKTVEHGVESTSLQLSGHQEEPAHAIAEQWFIQNEKFHQNVTVRLDVIEENQEEIKDTVVEMLRYHQ